MGKCKITTGNIDRKDFKLESWVQVPRPTPSEEENCVTGSSGDKFCLMDNNDGTAYITSGACGRIDNDFSIGYNPRIAVVSSGENESVFEFEKESVFVDKGNGGHLLTNVWQPKPSSPQEVLPLDSETWRGISYIPIPYDFDVFYNDGCGGTDWFFPDKPISMTALGGALHVGEYVITPDVFASVDDYGVKVLSKNSAEGALVRDMLKCALISAPDKPDRSVTERQVKSAFLMFLTGNQKSIVEAEGPHRFRSANIHIEMEKQRVNIKSKGQEGAPVTELDVTIKSGLIHETWFHVNRMGLLYNIDGIRIGLLTFDQNLKARYLQTLEDALLRVASEEDKKTIKTVMEIFESPSRPEWLKPL